MAPLDVLITGSSGLIGTAVWKRMADSPDRYRLYGFDLQAAPDRRRETMTGNVADFAAVSGAVAGKHTVVHLGANGGPGELWDRIRESNLVGAYNVFEAARQAGVKRVVFASTGQVTWNYEQEPPLADVMTGSYRGAPDGYRRIDHTWPVRPSGIYAASKVWGEALGRYYSDVHGISVIAIRFSAVNRPDTPLNPTPGINPGDVDDPIARSFSIWTSQTDAAQLVQRAVDAPPSLRFDIFYSGSRNSRGVRDTSHAEDVLGYRPDSSADDFRHTT
jgi:nucleoside-diphosphate-sugar epimerase